MEDEDGGIGSEERGRRSEDGGLREEIEKRSKTEDLLPITKLNTSNLTHFIRMLTFG